MSTPDNRDNQLRARQEETARINEFWSWWNSTGASALDAMFSAQLGGTPGAIGEIPIIDVSKEIGDRIAGISPRLIWGFEPGAPYSKHLMTVSAAGDPEVRPIARRWLDAAPDDNETWSFTDLRQADPSMTLDLRSIIQQLADAGLTDPAGSSDPTSSAIAPELAEADAVINPADARVAATTAHGAVDVRLFHPAFAQLAAMPDGDRLVAQLGFTLLQLTLGEEDFGLWLRGFAFAESEPEDAIPLPELPALVEDLASNCPEWLTIDAEANGQAVRVVTRAPITQLIAPTCTQHVVVQLLFTSVTEGGLPTKETLQELTRFSDSATDALGDDGIQVASETSDGIALLHFYVDPVSDAESRLSALLDGWSLGETDSESAYDPGWLRVGHLRV